MGKSFLLKPGEKFNKLTVIELAETKLYINPHGRIKANWSIEKALGYVNG